MRVVAVTLLSIVFSLQSLAPALADPVITPGSDPLDPGVVGSAESDAEETEGDPEVGPAASDTEYVWLLSCFDNYPGMSMNMCAGAQVCPSPDELMWALWSRPIGAVDSAWRVEGRECRGDEPPGAVPVVTDGLVLNEVRRLGLPRLTVRVQPAGDTLVNLETIFYAEPPQWARTVQLLGYSVDVAATVDSYDWSFGDGAATSTQTPGAPYPATDVVHEYVDADVTVRPRVDVAYAIRYRVDGGAWQTIQQTVPAAGYPVDLRIHEATAVLVGN